ncbi:Chorismate--pyruvate lyase [Bathymodiolus thermophilus thioautotrophic gill symbiont]|uniref:Probable chorismate pyruvate-lyase n=1 Tax=Bathymodiolus thermophilus thioautotrophic gill symbiont TaxID=2360 RepID=A0A1J5TZ10_9GAMM|nr:chorismate lyase [Bathymodiolus thermophilus thioautotrophic gill symbiont]AYQ56036.1 chorismate lyase [Bathymodiolus thermophilus thioautotrophic gill symbiont]OIR25444.1 chorismate lyase [Bathymodiolus thermophilus thioautotrophic gill symbiont]CAB5499375.1 Chorismate--pyruvate lyase (EC [Bathymodiolus thermophilus thioautotrophic gill symbiont]CAB5501355.1 Chorismate--pyruvate lyase (EC [Bathymodiolus thermophilus thioautotrophic gill symbiont]SHA10417.1 Chorismate--pyruvate lyase [Bathy
MNTKNLIWENLDTQTAIPETVKPWLTDDKSLTKKLKQIFADFSVNVLSQTQAQADNNEADLINFQADCIIREVELLGNQQAVVFARSIIPINDDTQDLLNIGSKPLGEILFNNPKIVRGQLQITHTGKIWGRRSTFTIGTSKLLVCEFFLEPLYA